MRKLVLILCMIVPLSNYAVDITHEVVDLDGESAHQFIVTDPDFPAYYLDEETGTYPESGYSYMWHTDEGHTSNEMKPKFLFEEVGLHNVYLSLTPRKKGEDFLRVFHTFEIEVLTGQTSALSNGNVTDIGMYVDGQARTGDKIYVVVPLNSCGKVDSQHNYEVIYDESRLEFSALLSQTNLEYTDNPPAIDMALGILLNRKIMFSYDWDTPRDDITAVIEFNVLVPAVETDEQIGLKFKRDNRAKCVNNVEIAFSTISGPYDPNYKESDISEVNVFENPDKKTNPTEVIYTIHFQNIGTAPVDSITIYDTLPLYLTFTSFEGSSESSSIVNASHSGGILEWIIAPDADVKGTNQSPTQPEPTTKGWVRFKAEISKEENIVYSICHCLSNTATIYFDSLAPIRTEADIITIGDSLCFSPDPGSQLGESFAQTICSGINNTSSSRKKAPNVTKTLNFIAYPNPSEEAFQLQGDVEKILGIEIFNSLGQSVLSLSRYEGAFSLNNQPSGLYFIKIITETEQQVIRIEKY